MNGVAQWQLFNGTNVVALLGWWHTWR